MASRFSVSLSPFAIEDLHAAVAYLRGVGATDQARTLIDDFSERVATLETFPRRGNIPKELEGIDAGEVRQLLLLPYRIFYEIIDSEVVVMMLADGRRNLPALLAQRLIDHRG
jgi:toxin ParE1/3/4